MKPLARLTWSAVLVCALAHGGANAPSQEARLTALDAGGADRFGTSAALSADTAVVGAASSDPQRSAAYVFTRGDAGWAQQAKLSGNGGAFGIAVGVSGDTALVGARDETSVDRGAAYVFVRNGSAWTQQARLTASDAADYDRFGASVALSGDTAVVGAVGGSAGRGAVYVFTRSGESWTQQARLTAEDAAAGDALGAAVAIDGDTVVAGAARKNADQGAVYVFRRSGTLWSQQAKLSRSDAAAGDAFGTSLALRGGTLVIGEIGRPGAQGAAYVFERSGDVWTQGTRLQGESLGGGNSFGASVAVAADAVAVSDPANRDGRGATYVFRRTGAAWTRLTKLTAADAADSDLLGAATAFDGEAVVAGAPGKDALQGAAYAFRVPAPAPPYFLATKVKLTADSANPDRSVFAASGLLNTGIAAPGFSGAAALDVGTFRLSIPGFTRRGRSLVYEAAGASVVVTPAGNDSSRSKLAVKLTGEPANLVRADGALQFRFVCDGSDARGAVVLTSGALRPGGVTAPDLGVLSARATVRPGAKSALKLDLGFADAGAPPDAPEDLTIRFGDVFAADLPASSFVRRRNAFLLRARTAGIRRAVVDFDRRRISIAGSGLDLGDFAPGGNAVLVAVTRGGEQRTASIRVTRRGATLVY